MYLIPGNYAGQRKKIIFQLIVRRNKLLQYIFHEYKDFWAWWQLNIISL